MLKALEPGNFLHILNNPEINYEWYYEIMRDHNIGGINNNIFDNFIKAVKGLPPLDLRQETDFKIFDKFDLNNITIREVFFIQSELIKRSEQVSKRCWH